jgi:amino acid transporter
MNPRQVFVREATGLVRQAGLFDVFQVNALSMTASLTLNAFVLMLPLMTTGNGIWQAMTLGFLLSLFVQGTYYILNVTLARSGGDYVYVSRLMHPSLGVMTAGMTGILGQLLFVATGAAGLWVILGLSPLLGILGLSALASAVTTPTYLTGLGLLIVFFCIALFVFGGPKTFFRFNNVCYIIATIGMIAAGVTFLMTSHMQFLNLFNSYAQSYGTSADDIINTANSLGFTMPGNDAWSVLVASSLCFNSFFWTTQSTYFGGEIKNVRRSAFGGMIGASAMWYVIAMLVVLAAYSTVGPELISAANWISFFNSSSWKIPTTTFMGLYVAIAANNQAMAIFFSVAIFAGSFPIVGLFMLIFSRVVFALSFDRFFPAWFADIDDRTHSPVKALLVFAVLSIIFIVLVLVPGYSSIAVAMYLLNIGTTGIFMIGFLLGSLSLTMMPYLHKDLYERSCPFKRKVGGVPAVSIVGAISSILLVLYEGIFIAYPAFYGVTPVLLQGIVGCAAFFFALYWAVRWFRKKQGIDIDMVFKEIPPE